ncbi:hypothetical protein [Nonomuraea rubra]|uniref:Uncharacterized protein n=1 Tax=Nonomuraea rubra TaxID=46180 RepID=A0A7X0NNX0_9ACTN|nr:hypothetical protein [Nonomuraea rubra]MBB6546892.1 hypothetical protein [Nonomuraea rubra]
MLSPVYRLILAIVAQAPDGLRAKDICRMLNLGMEPKHTESLRAQLKRLVARAILSEPEPGLLMLPRSVTTHRSRCPSQTGRRLTERCLRVTIPAAQTGKAVQ